MNADVIRAQLARNQVVVILRERSAAACLAKARVLARAGMGSIEVTWTTPGAASVVRAMARVRGATVGAGSILTAAQAREAVAAGARFLVGPVVVPAVAAAARAAGLPYLGGALTPTEILAAWNAGCRPVKVFPVSAVGGPAYVKAVLAPMPFLELCPTGGVTADNAADYLAAGATLVGLGGGFTAGGAGSLAAGARALRRSLRLG